jgi:hypothetical protein
LLFVEVVIGVQAVRIQVAQQVPRLRSRPMPTVREPMLHENICIGVPWRSRTEPIKKRIRQVKRRPIVGTANSGPATGRV